MRMRRLRMKRITMRKMRNVGMMSVKGRLKRIMRMKSFMMRMKRITLRKMRSVGMMSILKEG